jgi:predicted MFS family arabinose efflux permease
MYGVFFCLGTAETLFANASLAILPSVVSKVHLEKANGRLFAAELVANDFAGRSLGGVLYAVAASIPFLLDAGTFAASAALILALRGQYRVPRPEGMLEKTLVGEISEGLVWLLRHRLLFALAIMLGVGNLTFSATSSILVLFAGDILDLGSVGYGLLMTAGGVGGVLGSLFAERIGSLFGTGRTLFLAMLLQAPVFAAIALSGNPFVVGAMIALEGGVAFVWNVLTFALRQVLVPDELMGRVTSVYRLLGVGSGAFGALIGGLLAREAGLVAPYWFAAAVMVVAAVTSLPFVNNRIVDEARSRSSL